IVFKKQKEANYLMSWMAQADMRKNGHIHFSGQESAGVLYKQEFWDAYCIGYKETFWNDSAEPMAVRLTFAAGIIRNNIGATFKQSWHVTDLGALVTMGIPKAATPKEKEEESTGGKLNGIFFTDLEGNTIEEMESSQKVILVIESQSKEGHNLEIGLENEKYNFKYKGTELIDGKIQNYTIQSARDQLELEVIRKEN
ncbi:type VI secretion system tube protein TssD, partial [Xanthovirga aplysinae]|uniref:type VI secretion system tube protein TssD n=1 Tax=Xanthovirga aplysinae TaxID=2529853 RepID=UPI0024838148